MQTILFFVFRVLMSPYNEHLSLVVTDEIVYAAHLKEFYYLKLNAAIMSRQVNFFAN
jgi:hypothetical protein